MTVPNSNNIITAEVRFEILQIISRRSENIIPAKVNTFRQPNLAATVPAIGIAINDPIPIQSSNIPNVSSVIANLSLKNGTSGAQVAAPNPFMKKIARVECCCIV